MGLTVGPRERLLATASGDKRAGVTCAHTYSRAGSDLALDWMQWQPRWAGEPSGLGYAIAPMNSVADAL